MNMGNVIEKSYNISSLERLYDELSHNQIIENLKNDDCDDFIKVFSLINLESLGSKEEALIFIKHLTNYPTPIREACALKLEEVYEDKFFCDEIKERLLKAIIDINPNVCRAVCALLSKNEFLKEELYQDIINKIKSLLLEIKKNNKALGGFFEDNQKNRKNHAKNKKLFSLYWYLEGLSICICGKNNSEALEIFEETIKFFDYTIREKTAKILANIKNPPSQLLQIAKNDQNFYVKNSVYDKIDFED